ncbi:MAG: hypothetical protein AAB502_10200 [Chloroflexota bacterium]
MIYWGLLLHFYQPPTQVHSVLRQVAEECYRPVLDILRQHPHARVTVNINGVLTESLWEHGFRDILDGLRELGAKGQIEFTGSAKHHAILPLIPDAEMRRQIQLNHVTNRHFLGDAYRPLGFFPPELCYGPGLVAPLIEPRYSWVLASGVACPVDWPTQVVHEIRHGFDHLAVLFRDDVLSDKISFRKLDGRGFVEHLRGMAQSNGDAYVVTAMDAETFGHHHKGWERLFLGEAYSALADGLARDEAPAVRPATLSEIVDSFPRGAPVEPHPSSWSTSRDDLAAHAPYPLWKAPYNDIHRLQWEHTDICIQLVKRAEGLASDETSKRFAALARGFLDPALHSCQFWWASKRAGWDINMVHRGLLEQEEVILNACKAIECSSGAESVRREAYYLVAASRDLRAQIADRLVHA